MMTMPENEKENFTKRINGIVAHIVSGRPTTREFDGQFERYDGDEVATAIYRRSLKNPNLAKNIWKYISETVTMRSVEALKSIKTTELYKNAYETRKTENEKTDRYLESVKRSA